jgi:hypothetical protein
MVLKLSLWGMVICVKLVYNYNKYAILGVDLHAYIWKEE